MYCSSTSKARCSTSKGDEPISCVVPHRFQVCVPRLLAPQAFGIGVSCSIIGRASQNGPLGGLRPHLDRVHVTWPSLLVAPSPRPPLARVPEDGFDLASLLHRLLSLAPHPPRALRNPLDEHRRVSPRCTCSRVATTPRTSPLHPHVARLHPHTPRTSPLRPHAARVHPHTPCTPLPAPHGIFLG